MSPQCPQPPARPEGHGQPPHLFSSVVLRPSPPLTPSYPAQYWTTSWLGIVPIYWASSLLVVGATSDRRGPKFSVPLDLLWKISLLIRYKLDIFRSLWVQQFYICELLFGGYARFIPLDKMVYLYHRKPCPLEVH